MNHRKKGYTKGKVLKYISQKINTYFIDYYRKTNFFNYLKESKYLKKGREIMRGLVESIQDKNAILFVGAGVSMNLGLPSWNSLLDYIAKELDYEPEVFKSFGNALTLAEFYKIKKGDIGPLRSWMDRNWHSGDIKIEDSKIHKLIFDLDFPIIYTTNYDRWIERTYDCYKKNYKKITNVGDLVNLNSMHTQIIKFHGDFDDEKSIVLTESSYFERLDFETPLDISFYPERKCFNPL